MVGQSTNGSHDGLSFNLPDSLFLNSGLSIDWREACEERKRDGEVSPLHFKSYAPVMMADFFLTKLRLEARYQAARGFLRAKSGAAATGETNDDTAYILASWTAWQVTFCAPDDAPLGQEFARSKGTPLG